MEAHLRTVRREGVGQRTATSAPRLDARLRLRVLGTLRHGQLPLRTHAAVLDVARRTGAERTRDAACPEWVLGCGGDTVGLVRAEPQFYRRGRRGKARRGRRGLG